VSGTVNPWRWFPDASFYTDVKCLCCGVCCGSTDGDPCEHLVRRDGRWSCDTYADRFGDHRTVQGRPIFCVSIQSVIERTGGYRGCAYVEEIRRLRSQRGDPSDDLGRRDMPGA
jgi:hypothetical protein